MEPPSSSSRPSKRHRLHMDSSSASASASASASSSASTARDQDPCLDDDQAVVLRQNLSSASSALHGLLRKLGAGLDDFLPPSSTSSSGSSNQSAKLRKLLADLKADGEESRQLEALAQLCEVLSIGTEDSLGSFSVESFVPVLVRLMNHENNPDVMLLAARAITHLCDALPAACSAVVQHGGVTAFCARLLAIEYMDVAEQCLQALKKISVEQPTACLRAGALMAVLCFLDFFSTGVQRVALSTAANMCKKLPSDAADFVMEAVPLLINLLNYQDSQVLEHACVCLTRIAEAFASSTEKIDELCNHGLVAQVAGLIPVNASGGAQASLCTSTYTGLIRLLCSCASGSPLGAKTLLLLGISGILKDILSGSGIVATVSVSPEQVYEIVNLANELLPPLPKGIISLPICSNNLVKGPAAKKSSVDTSNQSEQVNETQTDVSAHQKLLHDQPELLQKFGVDLLPVLIQIYGAAVRGAVRYKCLSVIGKLMYFSTADMVQSLLGVANISSFLAGLLTGKDPQVLMPTLQIAEIIMDKLPGAFSKAFVREGVVHAIDALVGIDLSSSTAPPGTASSAEMDDSGGSVQGSNAAPPTSTEVPSANLSLRATVSVNAKTFKNKYFPVSPGSADVGVTDDLLHLKSLCAKLDGDVEHVKPKAEGKSKGAGAHSFDISADEEEYLGGVIAEILSELCKRDGVSTFEFIESGVVVALLNYLSCGTFMKQTISEANFPKLHQQALRRYKSFIATSLPASVKEGNDAPMTVLIQKLQDALSSLEHFPVLLGHSSRSSRGSTRLSSGLSTLSRPLRLRLCCAEGEKSLHNYSSDIVFVDPLASLAAVEEFLWPKVQRNKSGNSDSGNADMGVSPSSPSTSPASGHCQSTRSKSSEGKGKAVLESSSDEAKEPQTRNVSCRRATLDKDNITKQALDGLISEDELDASQAETNDTLMVEEDYVSEDEDDVHEEVLRDESLPVSIPEEVHDVKLVDSVDDATQPRSTSNNQAQTSSTSANRVLADSHGDSEFRNGVSFGSRGSMSFAAAAMAGLSSLSGRVIVGGQDRHGPLGANINDYDNKLIFTFGGKQISKHLTIYQAIQQHLAHNRSDDGDYNGSELVQSDSGRIWRDVFTVSYQKVDTQVGMDAAGGSNYRATKSLKLASNGNDNQIQHISLPDGILRGELPCDLDNSNPTYNVLALLRLLEGLNQLSPRLRVQAMSDDFAEGKISTLDDLYRAGAKVPQEEFVNSKLTPILTRQIQDVFALWSGGLPSWCYQMIKACSFLFPFETRRQYFYSTAFGLPRALHWLQQQQSGDNHSANEREVRVGRLRRQKVCVSRNRILDSAVNVMDMYASQKVVLEVEYYDEVGTGLGPTLEFYTLLSHDLQKFGLGMWRSNASSDICAMQIDGMQLKDVNSDNVSDGKKPGSDQAFESNNNIQAPLGLFPRPWCPNADVSDGSQLSKVIKYFHLLGQVIAKALQDGRVLDLPLSTAFYKLVLGLELDLHDIVLFDPEFGKILQEMQALVCRKKFLEAMPGNSEKAISDLRFHGASIDDLCLDFTLPGYPDYILKEGEGTMVGINNLEEFLCLVVDATVKAGIMRQMEAFRAGFNQVFDISSLRIFSPHELDYMLCGHRELWEPKTLVENIKFDHGYTAESPAIVNLLEIMGEFSPEQQHAFCQFVTGAPRLPPGGLATLNPKLTIVRKVSASNGTGASESVDNDLPSVMTCANYLKLPPYSTKEIMLKKLLYAISEGQGSFDLS